MICLRCKHVASLYFALDLRRETQDIRACITVNYIMQTIR
jgi:hypothetical protein